MVTASAAIRYVKQDATGNISGSSWENAHTSLSFALLDAASNDEIWIAEGTYLPEIEGTGGDLIPGIRARSFGFLKDLTCYGGFAGDETARSQRDWVAHPTILSGNLSSPGSYSDNAYTVLHIYSSKVMIDGVTIRDGNSDAWAGGDQRDFDGRGGGAYIRQSHVTFANCRFINNYAAYGGAINAQSGDALNLINCAFTANRALYIAGAVNSSSDSHLISHCTFVANR